MTFEQITEVLEAQEISLPGNSTPFEYCFSSDLMSDVLTLKSGNLVLITGLYHPQALHAAEIAEIPCVIFARNKNLPPELIELAKELNIGIIKTPFSVFKSSALLYNHGLKPLY